GALRLVGFPIDVLLDILGGGEGGCLGEFHGALGLGSGGAFDLLDERLGEDLFVQELALENLDRILRVAVVLDLFPVPVGFVRIGDGVAAVAIGIDLDNGGFGLLTGAGERLVHRGAHLVNIVAATDIPFHVVGLGALAELARGGAGLGGAHGVAVV